jgi:hypothetical protein
MAFSLSQRFVSASLHSAFMADPVWHRVDRELERRKLKHLSPSSWASLGRQIEATDQRINNWSRRGIPARQHVAIANALGWSVNQLLGIDAAHAATQSEPPKLEAKFADPRRISDEEFELVRDFRDLADGDREKFKATLQQMAEAYRAMRRQWLEDLKTKGMLKEDKP